MVHYGRHDKQSYKQTERLLKRRGTYRILMYPFGDNVYLKSTSPNGLAIRIKAMKTFSNRWDKKSLQGILERRSGCESNDDFAWLCIQTDISCAFLEQNGDFWQKVVSPSPASLTQSEGLEQVTLTPLRSRQTRFYAQDRDMLSGIQSQKEEKIQGSTAYDSCGRWFAAT